MEPDGWPYIQLIASAILLGIYSFAAGVASENASPRDIAESGVGAARRVIAACLGAALLLAWNLACLARISLSAAALIVRNLTDPLSSYYPFWGELALGIVILIIGALPGISLFVLLPNASGRSRADDFAEEKGGWVSVLCAPLLPFVRVMCAPARLALERRGLSGGHGAVTEEDVLDDVGELDEIDDNQREMIGNIFELDDVTASDIMTHRIEIEAAPADATLAEIVEKSVSTGYSRLPVYDGTLDNIIGALSVKDLLPYVGVSADDFSISSLVRDTLYVHESCRARDLLIQFKANKMPLAVVVDEYGGTAGIVSMEDILESIVGDIEDEYDEEEKLITRRSDGSLVCDGYAEVEEVCEALGLPEPPEEIESDTIGGLLTVLLGRIPDPDERASALFDRVELTALAADERRITKVSARLIKGQ